MKEYDSRYLDGLKRFFSTIKETPDLQSLPETYHSVVEWGRFS
jgi:hypothetical protein